MLRITGQSGFPTGIQHGAPKVSQPRARRLDPEYIWGGISWETALRIPAAAIGLVGSATSWEECVGGHFPEIS